MREWLETLKNTGSAAAENTGFFFISIASVALILAAAKGAEALADRRNGRTEGKKKDGTRRMVTISMLSAIAVILMLFEVPLPFLPAFYKIDLSELPVIIGAFALGPAAGVLIEFIKILLNLLVNGTQTAFIGEFANFLIGCAFVVPAAVAYYFKKTKKNALLGLLLGLAVCTVSGCLLNAYLLLPAYGRAFHMEVDQLVAMGTAVNAGIHSLLSFVILATAPLNVIKCAIVTSLTMLTYKPLSRILKGSSAR